MSKRVSLHSAGLGLALLFAACSGDGDAADGGGLPVNATSGQLTTERFERGLAEAVCDAADICNLGTFMAQLREDGDCVEAMQRYISGSGLGLARQRAAVRYGEAAFDAEAARACLDSFVDRCPTRFNLLVNGVAPTAWCPEAFRNDCWQEDKVPWEPPLPRGAGCEILDYGAACAAGTGCAVDSHTCEPCDGTNGQSLRCNPEPAEALAEVLLRDRPEGVTCEYEGVRAHCNAGLVCTGYDVVCAEPRRAGEACEFGTECASRCGGPSCTTDCDGAR